jgi:cytochrome c oxidase assembly protein subunit 15
MSSMQSASLRATPSAILATGFAALVAAAAGLMVLGALVRAHGAGLACPDWPLCFGEAIPRFDFHVAFEVGHRYWAGLLSLAFVFLALRTRRDPAAWQAVRGGILLAAALLGVQVLLGALTVWKLLAVWTVTAHLLTANAFAVTLLCVALRLGELARGGAPRAPARGAGRVLVRLAALSFVAQLVLGGLVSSSYAGLACPEWPTCADGRWLPAGGGNALLHFVHRLNAYALFGLLAVGALALRGDPARARLGALALGLCALQIAVGVANVLLALPVEVTGLHSALAAALSLVLAATLR